MGKHGETYFGGKAGAGVVQTLVNHVPPHEILLVPFAGHCALSRAIRPCRKLLIYDLDREVQRWWQDRLPKHAEFRQANGLEVLESLRPSTLDPAMVAIYCDPPYPLETRTSDSRYRFDWTDAEHDRLLETATRLSAAGYRMLISSYRNPAYDNALQSWNRTDFTGHTRGGPRIESLYFNFEITDLHDFRFYCGTSSKQSSPRRQREVMRRREQSALRKIRAMAPMERKRFLRSLAAEFGVGSSCLQEETREQATGDRELPVQSKRKAARKIERPFYR